MSTDLQKRTPLAEVCATIASPDFGAKLAQALPDNVTLDRFQRVTLTAIQQNPDLIGADRSSLYNSVIRCAQDGLLPNGREAALVIFNEKGAKKCVYMPMVGGLRKTAAEHGVAIEAHVVYKEDAFDWRLGYEPSITHIPPPLDQPRGEPIGAYAVATDRDGRKYLEVMSKQEIEQVRAVSRTKPEYSPWTHWWGEMARKTVARRLFKQLPLGALDERASRVLDAHDADTEFEPPVEREPVREALTGILPPVDDEPPDDSLYAEPAEGEVVDETPAETLLGNEFEQMAETAVTRRRQRETGE